MGDGGIVEDSEYHEGYAEGQLIQVAEFVKVDAVNAGASEEVFVGDDRGLFDRAAGVDDGGLPVAEAGSLAVEVEEGFSKEAFVKLVVALELDFTKVDGAGGLVFGREKDTVDLEFGFFDGNGVEAVLVGVGGSGTE